METASNSGNGAAVWPNAAREQNTRLAMAVGRSMALVLRRSLHVIDDKHFDRALLRFQFQSELFLQGRKQRWSIGIGRRQRRQTWRRNTSWRRLKLPLLRGVVQIDIVLSREI